MKPPLRVPAPALTEGPLSLEAAASRYVALVHRLGVGARVVLFADGREADAVITRADPERVEVDVGTARALAAPRDVTLLQALGKGEKLDAVVRDATELGATRVVPVVTARTVPKLGDKAETKLARWRAIALDAARQCGRASAPEIAAPEPLTLALARQADQRVMLTPGAPSPLAPLLLGRGSLLLAIGPEGGFSPDEQREAEAHGFALARLGAAVLRTETVAAAVLGAALVLDELSSSALPSPRD